MQTPFIKVALVDDHQLFRKGLVSLIKLSTNDTVSILFEAGNGNELRKKLDADVQPDIIIMDINMPEMDGFQSVIWLKEHFPFIKVLIVSMINKEESILKMLKLGVKGYLSKDVEPKELAEALNSIANKGYYYTDFITGKLIHSLNNEHINTSDTLVDELSEREREFLKLTCTDLTYNEMATKLYVSPKTIDGCRAVLFERLGVKNRVGLALFAVKHKLVEL
ncbi:MAG: response regulator transcription factor [Bacteroidetes bacterium]|nr:response regulator transcription factor [Bacteroidota bacterium]